MKAIARFINDKGEKIASLFLAIFAAFSLLLMLALVGVGLVKMGLSIPTFLGLRLDLYHSSLSELPIAHTEADLNETAVGKALDGLECIFLAPLAFLLVRGIWDFVDSVVRSRSEQKALSSVSPVFMVRVKALIIGLMVAVVATDLLKRALSKSGLLYEPAIAGCLFIAALAGYAALIDRSPSQNRNDTISSEDQL